MAVDNLGSGTFLPLSVVYLDRVVGLGLASAGLLLTVGGVVGLLVPAVAGRAAERVGPRAVVVTSQLLQAAGLGALLLARGPALALLGTVLLAAGTQSFYSAVFGLVADVAPPGPLDRAYTVFGMVRSAAFGFGALAAGVLLTAAGTASLTAVVAFDAVTFVLAAAMLLALVHPRHVRAGPGAPGATAAAPGGGVLRNRPFLALTVVTGLIVVATDLFLVGLPVFALDVLGTPAWVPAVCLAALTAASSLAGTLVLRRTRGWSRTDALARGAWLTVLWCLGCAVTLLLPESVAAGWLIAVTGLIVAADLLVTTRVNALAEAAAPPAARGRHLAAFQYAFGVAAVVAPLLVATFDVAPWLPFTVVAAGCLLAVAALPRLARALPPHAVRPGDSAGQRARNTPVRGTDAAG